jgi:hypothetical protein
VAKLIQNGQDTNDAESFAMEWVNHVNGTDVFPKLPVHTRKELKAWNIGGRIKYSAKKTKEMRTQVDEVNA